VRRGSSSESRDCALLVEDCCCSSTPALHDAAMTTMRVLAAGILSAQHLTVALEKAK
jgi:hypothetical protein